jgi:hypothetical protein
MKFSSATNLSLLASLICFVITVFVVDADAILGENESINDHRNLRKRDGGQEDLYAVLPTLPELPPYVENMNKGNSTIEEVSKGNSTLVFMGANVDSSSTKQQNQLPVSSSAVETAATILPAAQDGKVSTQAVIGYWKTCNYGSDICQDSFNWKCCVAPADCWNKKSTCRSGAGQCSSCGSNVYKTIPDTIRAAYSSDNTWKCLTMFANGSLGLFTCNNAWYQQFKVDYKNRLQLAGTNYCLSSGLRGGASVTLSQCNDNNMGLQSWYYYPSTKEYKINIANEGWFCMDIPWSNIVNYAKLQIWKCNSSAAQKFY